MINKALKLASHGFHVFPLLPGKKLPAIKAWQNQATDAPDWIELWWKKWPSANIGICCTRFGNDRALLVVDVDNKNGVCGDDSLFALEMEGKLLPPTLVSLTPTGGRHLIYVVDIPVANSAGKLGKGLDIRSHNGFIVAPGSIVEAGEYRWR